MMKYLQKLGKALFLPVAILPICELVVAGSTDDAAQDADEGVGDLTESNLIGLAGDHVGSNDADSADGQQGGDHQPADQTVPPAPPMPAA